MSCTRHNFWEKYGGPSLIKDHKNDIEKILKTVNLIKTNKKCSDRLTNEEEKICNEIIYKKTGLSVWKTSAGIRVTYNGEHIIPATMSTDKCMEKFKKITKSQKISIEKALHPDEYMDCLLTIADRIEQQKAHIRYSLKNLRKKALDIVLIDPMVIAIKTSDISNKSKDERILAYCNSIKETGYRNRKAEMTKKDDLIGDQYIIKANILTTRTLNIEHKNDMLKKAVFQGSIIVRKDIPETVISTLKGRSLDSIMTGHPANGMGLKIKNVEFTKDYLTIQTDSLTAKNLIAYDLITGEVL